MVVFGSASPWLAFLKDDANTKTDAASSTSGPDSDSDTDEDAGAQGESAETTPEHPEPEKVGAEEDEQSKQRQQRLYERVAELSDQALTTDAVSQGVFSDPRENGETSSSEPGSAARHDASAASQQPAAIPENEQEKLRELQKEFGQIEYSDNSKIDEERYTADVPAALIVGVMVRGMAFLTNHRLAFYAVLPNLTEEEGEPRQQQRLTGTGTIHFASSFKPKKKAFFVLKNDSINAFSNPRKLDHPWGCVHFSTIESVKPLETCEDTQWLEFTFTQRIDQKPQEVQGRIEFDDAVTASRWRNELSAALFQFKNKRDRFRASVPLERIEHIDVQAWGDFAQVVSLTVIQAEGERRALDLGFLSQFKNFVDQLVPAVELVRSRHCGAGAEPASNLPTIEISAPSRHSAPPAEALDGNHDDDEEDDPAKTDGDFVPTARQIERFRFDFGLFGEHEDVYFVALGSLAQTIPVFGKLALSKKGVIFSRKTAMINNVKIFLPAEIVKGARPSQSILTNSSGLHIIVRGQEDLALVFPSKRRRDAVIAAVRSLVEQHKASGSESSPSTSPSPNGDKHAHRKTMSSIDGWASTIKPASAKTMPLELVPHLPKMLGSDHLARISPRTFACLTIGSRGDIQPYIALGKGLKAQGHTVYILTHDEYGDWIKSHGLQHRPVGGDPGLLMEISVEHKIFDAETQKRFRKWFEDLLRDAYKETKSCGAHVLIESPSAFAGLHVAEALRIPFFRAFSMPWTKTGDFPHAFINGPQTLSRAYNTSTYLLFDQLIWRASSSMINRWRKEQLHLPPTDLDHVHDRHVMTLYFFSENIVSRPMDWPSWVQITGPWVLEKADSDWTPPKDLEDFINKAKADQKPLVYCGFGSITVSDPVGLTNAVVESVKAADVRLILSKGWSGRMRKSDEPREEPKLPAEVYTVDSIPHDWLFPQLDAAMHHGGAGTTSASLSAGVPTLSACFATAAAALSHLYGAVRPFFGDQYFWANRVQLLGAGLKVKGLSADDLTDAWKTSTKSRVMKERAEMVGQKLRAEDGVGTAIRLIFAYLASAQEAMKPGKAGKQEQDGNSGKPIAQTPREKSVLIPTPGKPVEESEAGSLSRTNTPKRAGRPSGSSSKEQQSPTRQQTSPPRRKNTLTGSWLVGHRSRSSSSAQRPEEIPRTTSPKSFEV